MTLPARRMAKIDPALLQQAAALRRKYVVLAEPQVMARFLCGLNSPALIKNKLGGHALFGTLCDVPFAEVERQCGAVSDSS